MTKNSGWQHDAAADNVGAGLVGSCPMTSRDLLATKVVSGCKLKVVRMTSPIRSRRNRNRPRINAAATAESVQGVRARENQGGGWENRRTLIDVRTAGDVQLLRQAVREGWPVLPEKRRQIVEHVFDVAMTDERDRMAIRCARLLVAMEAANIRDDKRSRY